MNLRNFTELKKGDSVRITFIREECWRRKCGRNSHNWCDCYLNEIGIIVDIEDESFYEICYYLVRFSTKGLCHFTREQLEVV